ncbi:hypothetical protein [Acinetobacter radioresistens]|jgi:hypothetical protein|nr:hypothetical protein [Acinetobacter radioresistens]
MKYTYSSITRTLTVFGCKMDHIFTNVGLFEIEALLANAKFKEATWRN